MINHAVMMTVAVVAIHIVNGDRSSDNYIISNIHVLQCKIIKLTLLFRIVSDTADNPLKIIRFNCSGSIACDSSKTL